MRTRKTLIILISGLAGSGKTTTLQILKDKIDNTYPELNTVRYSFANPIKFVAQAFFTWDKEKDEKGRKLLQDLGKVGRAYNEDVWVKHLLAQMDKNFGSKTDLFPTNVVIADDWRFPNEAETLRKNPMIDVTCIRLFGRGGLSGEVADDVSETSLPEIEHEAIPTGLEGDHWYDFQIDNGADIDALKVKLDSVLLEIAKQYIVE